VNDRIAPDLGERCTTATSLTGPQAVVVSLLLQVDGLLVVVLPGPVAAKRSVVADHDEPLRDWCRH
jgi:hypothetical protein